MNIAAAVITSNELFLGFSIVLAGGILLITLLSAEKTRREDGSEILGLHLNADLFDRSFLNPIFVKENKKYGREE